MVIFHDLYTVFLDFPWEHGVDYEKMYGIFGFLICRYSDIDTINMIDNVVCPLINLPLVYTSHL